MVNHNDEHNSTRCTSHQNQRTRLVKSEHENVDIRDTL